jgi:hypothetical protein
MGTTSDKGLESMARMINGVSAPAAFTRIANGTGSTAEANNQTALVTENTLYGAARKVATCTFTSPATATWDALFSFTGNVTVRELGIFNAASSGDMLYRRLLASNRSYVDGDSMEVIITHTFARG